MTEQMKTAKHSPSSLLKRRAELSKTLPPLEEVLRGSFLEREIQTVETLIQQARAIIQTGEEVKLRHFREALDDLNRQHPGAKIRGNRLQSRNQISP